jgi:methionyl-tRNA synthetase
MGLHAAGLTAQDLKDSSMITIQDFAKVELKTGKIKAVEVHPNADRLLVVKVDIGEEQERQLVAGIRPAYPDPQSLVGATVAVVANLQPAKLRGVESQGMLLAATGEGAISVLVTDKDVPPGLKIT